MLNAVREYRAPIKHDYAAHTLLLQETAPQVAHADRQSIREFRAAISPFDEYRFDLLSADFMFDQRAPDRAEYPENKQIEILHRLACAAECRDGGAGPHPYRVGELAALMGRALNFSEQRVELIRIAASLHDVGKLGIPDEILLKPGKLTADEYEED